MHALFATAPHPDDPFGGVSYGDRPDPEIPDGWVRVRMIAGSLNRHDLWTLRGVGIRADAFPMVLGCDGAGVLDDGTAVVIYPVIGDPGIFGDETLDPARSLLTERHQGVLASWAVMPARNAVPMPAGMDPVRAATLGTSYLTAYRMLFGRGRFGPGDTVLVQGATGGVSTALIQLGRAAGLRVWVTSRTDAGRRRALSLGAAGAFESGARLPERVDGVLESIGAATWSHTMRSVRPGGVVVCCGATSGAQPPADLQRLFFQQISVIGSTMGTLAEFRSLLGFLGSAGVTPVVDQVRPLAEGADALAELENGTPGKIVLTM